MRRFPRGDRDHDRRTGRIGCCAARSGQLRAVIGLAESILRTANAGETEAAVLQRMALLELQIVPRV